MSIEQNKALVRGMIEEAFNQGKLSVIDDYFSPDFVENEELPPGVPTGREGSKALTAALREAFPDFKATIEDMIAEDDKVFLRMTWSGTQAAEFMGIPSSGKHFTIGVFDVMRIKDGKIAEHWGQSDMMSMMEQLGAMPGPGPS